MDDRANAVEDDDVPSITINGENVEDPDVRSAMLLAHGFATILLYLISLVTDLGPNDYLMLDDEGLRWARSRPHRTIVGRIGSAFLDRLMVFIAGLVQFGPTNVASRFVGSPLEFDGNRYANAMANLFSQQRHVLIPHLRTDVHVDRFGHVDMGNRRNLLPAEVDVSSNNVAVQGQIEGSGIPGERGGNGSNQTGGDGRFFCHQLQRGPRTSGNEGGAGGAQGRGMVVLTGENSPNNTNLMVQGQEIIPRAMIYTLYRPGGSRTDGWGRDRSATTNEGAVRARGSYAFARKVLAADVPINDRPRPRDEGRSSPRKKHRIFWDGTCKNDGQNQGPRNRDGNDAGAGLV